MEERYQAPEIKVDSFPHSICTVSQMALLTDSSYPWVYQQFGKLDKKRGGSKLDICYPWPDSTKDEDKETGPKFIIMNDKYDDLVKDCKATVKRRREKAKKESAASAPPESSGDQIVNSDDEHNFSGGPMG